MNTSNRTLSTRAFCALFCAASSAFGLGGVKTPSPLPAGTFVKTAAVAPVKAAAEIPARADIALQSSTKRIERDAPAVELFDSVVYAEEDGVIAASAHGFKARFATDGVRFTPYFGAEAARSAPIAFDVRSITIAGAAVDARASSVSRDAQRVSIERGAIDEVFAATRDSIEQLFVVRQRVCGELRVRVGFAGDYAVSTDEDGIRFENDLGVVHYGKAHAVDANGATTEVEEVLHDDAIELVVPGAWLAQAAYPLTIDPVIAAYSVHTSIDTLLAPDVAYEAGSDVQAFVFERVFSGTDHDVFVRKANDAGALGSYIIDDSLENWSAPSIASNRESASFLVACQAGIDGVRRIKTRMVSANSSSVGPVQTLAAPPIGEQISPAVGGDPSGSSPTYFLVACIHALGVGDQDVLGQLVSANGQATGGILFLDGSYSTLDSNVAISKSNGTGTYSTQIWTLAWERMFGATDQDVYAMEVNWDGSIRHDTFAVLTSTSDERAPSVSSPTNEINGERASVVAIQRGGPSGNADTMLAALKNGQRVFTLNLDASIGNPFDSHAPVVDCDGKQFMVASSLWVGGSDYDIDICAVTFAEGILHLNQQYPEFLANTSAAETMLAVTAKHSGGQDSEQFVFGWRKLALGSNSEVRAAVYEGPHGGPLEPYCGGPTSSCPCSSGGSGYGGCPNSANTNGASLTGMGAASVSDDSCSLVANGMPNGAAVLFFQGTIAGANGVGLWFGDGLLCVGGTITRLGVKFASNGSATYPSAGDALLSVRGALPTDGGMRTYQGWYRDAAAYCSTSTFNLTNGVRGFWMP